MSAATTSYRLGLVMEVLDDAREPLDLATLRHRTKLRRTDLVATLVIAGRRGLIARHGTARVVSRARAAAG